MTKWKDCSHEWLLSLTVNPYVFCPKCEASFKPQNQQMSYKGIVPEQYK
jgi:hypothetical protein